MTVESHAGPWAGDAYRHEALLYDGDASFVDAAASFIAAGLEAEEAVLVAVVGPKIDMLRSALNGDASDVTFVDLALLGNPARIIPAWREFVDGRRLDGGGLRGIGEPIWPARQGAELVECQRHESLLNYAFGPDDPLWLLCPYDVNSLGPAVLEEAQRSHPFLVRDGHHVDSDEFQDYWLGAAPDSPLEDAPADCGWLAFGPNEIQQVREIVTSNDEFAGLGPDRAFDLGLSVSELATNSVRYGGGTGTLRFWRQGDMVICEVSDRGKLQDPLAGRRAPDPEAIGRRGLWMANQLCDLVQIRVFDAGSVVRVHMALNR